MRRPFAQQLKFALAIALLLLIVNAIVSYRSTAILVRNEQQVSHSHQVLTEIEKTLSTLKDAETGQRGYLLTGDEQYLHPYQTAIAQVNQELNRLRQLTANHARQ